MAMTGNGQEPVRMLDGRYRVLASTFSLALSLVWLLGLAIYVFTRDDIAGWVLWACLIKIALGVALVVIATRMLRGRCWAQQVLLVYWLLVLGDGILLLVGMMLSGEPEWWSTYFGWPMPVILLPVVALSGGVVALLFLASLGGSRLRYASMVDVSVVIALVLAVVVNLIAHSDPYRRDFETLGRYGLSDRTRRILADVDKKVAITCVYTSREEGKAAEEYRPRVMEMLEEIRDTMSRGGGDATITNVVRDSQRVSLATRLRERQSAEQKEHVALVNEFVSLGEDIEDRLRRAHEQWSQMPDSSYLTMWGLTANVSALLQAGAESVAASRRKIHEGLQIAGLPDYTALITDLQESLGTTRGNLAKAVTAVDTVRAIPASVASGRDSATAALTAASKAASRMVATLDEQEGVPVADPSERLKAFSQSAREAAREVRAASRMLAELGGKEQSEIIRASSYYSVPLKVGGFQVRSDLVDVLGRDVAKPMESLAYEAEAVVKNAKASYQAEHIERLRKEAEAQRGLLEQIRQFAMEAMSKLGTADPGSKAIFEQAERGDLFAEMIRPMSGLLDRMEDLPEAADRSLPSELAEENIVLVEVGDQAKVATFESVWPRQMRQAYPGAAPGQVRRAFNGDSAIGSLLLSMTHAPFARVLLVHYRPQVPPQMARMVPPSSLPVEQLTTLRAALKEANLEVQEWNLAEAKPEPENPQDPTPTVLLILPPAPELPFGQYGGGNVPSFGEEELAKIREEIDAGTPAIFLSMHLPSLQVPMYYGAPPLPVPQYELIAQYLRDTWGVDVKKDHRVVKGIPDQTVPGAFRIDVLDFSFLPVSTFAETHPIGAPLQGQRVFWIDACPILLGEPVEGVKVDSLLEIPSERTDYWGAGDIAALVMKIRDQQEGLVRPDFSSGDIRPPMSLAVAATRNGDVEPTRSPSRIVVLGVGRSMSDGYIDTPVVKLDAQGGIRMDEPPRANADLVVNSVYWLTGHERLIASGPAKVKPIRNISAVAEKTLQAVCLGGLPLMVCVLGVVVLFIRRR
jgi:hypothetical protein